MLKKFLLSAAVVTLLSAPAYSGDPVPGVDVLLEQIPGGSIYSATTDANGNMRFDGLPPGTFRVYQDLSGAGQSSGSGNPLRVSGAARFTPSNGDDIGTLVVTSSRPVMIAEITPRSNPGAVATPQFTGTAVPLDAAAVRNISRQTGMQITVTHGADETDGEPLSAEDVNSTRSNNGGIVGVPVEAEDAVPLSAESLNSVRCNNCDRARQIAATQSADETDGEPLSAESLNSTRSNDGLIVATPVDAEGDAVPLGAYDVNSSRSNTGGIVATPQFTGTVVPLDAAAVRNIVRQNGMQITATQSADETDGEPLSAESLNSSRSNKGNGVEEEMDAENDDHD